MHYGARANSVNRLSLRVKVTLLLLAVSLAPLLVAGLVNVNRAVDRGKRSERLRFTQSAGHAAQAFGDAFEGLLSDLRRLSRRFPVEAFDFAAAAKLAENKLLQSVIGGWKDAVIFTELDTDYAITFAALPDGRIFYVHPYHNTGMIDLAKQPWFDELKPEGNVIVSRIKPLTSANRPGLIGVVPIQRGDRLYGYLGVVVEGTRLDQIIHRTLAVDVEASIGTTLLGLIDRAGTAAAGSTLRDQAALDALAELPSTGTVEVDIGARHMLVSRVRVEATPWRVQLITPTRHAYRHVYQLIWLLTVIIVLTFLFVLLFADYLGSVMLRPIGALERGAEMIGRGAFDYRIELDQLHGSDGLGRLARAFNSMGENLEVGARNVRAYSRSLENANQELDALVFGITHDLKKSLRGIGAFATFLEEDYGKGLGDDGVDMVHKIGGNVEFISKLADDLIALVEQRRDQAEATRFMMSDLVNESASRVLETRRGDVAVPDDMPEVMADHDRLLLVFQNLIDNGLKFNRSDDPLVTVTWADEGNEWRFEVADNGIGIDPEYHDHIFGLFHRLNDQSEFPGSGTGLNLARRIIEQHRGELALESAAGEGACFTVRLPKEASFVTSPGVRLSDL